MDKERQSNYELLRLVLMLMIVAQHIINNGVLSKIGSGNYALSIPVGSIGIFFEVTVNSFILVSGFFGIRLKFKRIIRLIIDMVVIGLGVYLVFVLAGYRSFTLKDAVYYMIPIHWWFIIYYIILSLFAPYLNRMADVLQKKSFFMLLMVMYFAFSIAPTFLGYDFGGGITTFILMYMIGRYIKIHFNDRHNIIVYLSGYVIFSLLSAAGNIYLHKCRNVPYDWGITFFLYNSVFLIAASVCFFMIFSKFNIKSTVINRLAKTTLGIYMLHEHPVVREFYLEKMGVLDNVFSSFGGWVINFIITLFVVYFTCLIVETVRLFIFDKINNKLADIIYNIKFVKRMIDFTELENL